MTAILTSGTVSNVTVTTNGTGYRPASSYTPLVQYQDRVKIYPVYETAKQKELHTLLILQNSDILKFEMLINIEHIDLLNNVIDIKLTEIESGLAGFMIGKLMEQKITWKIDYLSLEGNLNFSWKLIDSTLLKWDTENDRFVRYLTKWKAESKRLCTGIETDRESLV
jgi:hypothetical protein